MYKYNIYIILSVMKYDRKHSYSLNALDSLVIQMCQPQDTQRIALCMLFSHALSQPWRIPKLN